MSTRNGSSRSAFSREVSEREGSMRNEAVCAGVDWAKDDHAVLVADQDGERLWAATVTHDEAGIADLCRRLVSSKVERDAIERPDGLLVERLLDAGLTCWRFIPTRSRQPVTEKRLAQFLARHHYCGRKNAAELLERPRKAPTGRAAELEADAGWTRRAVQRHVVNPGPAIDIGSGSPDLRAVIAASTRSIARVRVGRRSCWPPSVCVWRSAARVHRSSNPYFLGSAGKSQGVGIATALRCGLRFGRWCGSGHVAVQTAA